MEVLNQRNGGRLHVSIYHQLHSWHKKSVFGCFTPECMCMYLNIILCIVTHLFLWQNFIVTCLYHSKPSCHVFKQCNISSFCVWHCNWSKLQIFFQPANSIVWLPAHCADICMLVQFVICCLVQFIYYSSERIWKYIVSPDYATLSSFGEHTSLLLKYPLCQLCLHNKCIVTLAAGWQKRKGPILIFCWYTNKHTPMNLTCSHV